MGLDVLLEILRPLEGLAAEVAFVRLEWHVDAYMRSDVVALDSSSAASAPCTGQVEVVGALAPNVAFTHMVLKVLSATRSRAQTAGGGHAYVERLCTVASLAASLPLAGEVVDS